MRKLGTFTTAAVLALGIAGTALAQTTPPADAEHEGHHPDAPPAAHQPAAPPGRGAPAAGMAGPGGMMGGDMGRMMQQMMQGRMAAAAMQPFRRIEGQLAFFRAELRITDPQVPQWTAFADAVRAQAERLRGATQQAVAGGTGPAPAPQQMERRIAFLTAQMEAMRAVSAAAAPLYATLSEEQRRTADELMAEHFRSMRMGMP
jgi:hypothetical protein